MDLTIALTRYNEPAWLLKETLDSLAVQQDVAARVLFLDQLQNDDGLRDHCMELSSGGTFFEHRAVPPRSLSFARNEAIRLSQTDILLFIDSDAVAKPDWAKELAAVLARPGAAIAGGRILPRWHGKPPWLSKAGIVLDQYSMLDLGINERQVNRVVGASLGLNLATLGELARFDEALGRRDGILLSGEESDLCRRAKAAGHQVIYSGRAVVHHQVLPERISSRWIVRRMYYAGMARAAVGGGPNPSRAMTAWDYAALPFVFPPYILGYLAGRRRG